MNLARALTITGWMTEPELRFLAECASKSTVIFEAGSFEGRSTRGMADNTNGVIYAVDPWVSMPLSSSRSNGGATVGVNECTYTMFHYNLLDHIESGRVFPVKGRFTEFDPIVIPDFVFIDAMHDYRSVKADIVHALKLMKHGILAGHDYNNGVWPDVSKAVHDTLGDNIKITGTIWSIEL
jgi:hypothetical protein